MKLTTRGFTLVELMIVIAIIGILASALFPSLTAYLKRSRDAARISHLKDISNAIGGFYSDKEQYPLGDVTAGYRGCMYTGVLSTSYLEGTYPVDPTTSKSNDCVLANFYAYASTGTSASGVPRFVLGAVFENQNGGNIDNSGATTNTLSGIVQGASPGVLGTTEIIFLEGGTNVKKGNGSGYLIYK